MEDLAARVKELEEELGALRAALAGRMPEVPTTAAPPGPSVQASRSGRRTLRRPLTRLGLLAAAGAAGASAVLPAGARAETHSDAIRPHAQIISPNGLYTLDVVNSGIYLKGPNGGIELTSSQIRIAASVPVAVTGSLLTLNNGNQLVARVGDTVVLSTGGTGTIQTGNPLVRA
jgi:hypothetical protein